MRDLVLAKQMESENEIIFACQGLEGNAIKRIPYEVKILQSNDANELIALIKDLHVNLLVIDHYGIDVTFEKAVKEATGVTILSFDDTYQPHYCDILLNHNICADASRYASLIPKGCELRCGSAYTLIRDEFREEKRHKRAKIYDIFIAMGGTDAGNLTHAILNTIPENLRVAVLTTTANTHLETLKRYVIDKPNIVLHVNSNEVAKMMHQSCLAIITPSVIAHEVLFMNIPLLAIKVASNQDDMLHYLEMHKHPVMKSFESHILKAMVQAQIKKGSL